MARLLSAILVVLNFIFLSHASAANDSPPDCEDALVSLSDVYFSGDMQSLFHYAFDAIHHIELVMMTDNAGEVSFHLKDAARSLQPARDLAHKLSDEIAAKNIDQNLKERVLRFFVAVERLALFINQSRFDPARERWSDQELKLATRRLLQFLPEVYNFSNSSLANHYNEAGRRMRAYFTEARQRLTPVLETQITSFEDTVARHHLKIVKAARSILEGQGSFAGRASADETLTLAFMGQTLLERIQHLRGLAVMIGSETDEPYRVALKQVSSLLSSLPWHEFTSHAALNRRLHQTFVKAFRETAPTRSIPSDEEIAALVYLGSQYRQEPSAAQTALTQRSHPLPFNSVDYSANTDERQAAQRLFFIGSQLTLRSGLTIGYEGQLWNVDSIVIDGDENELSNLFIHLRNFKGAQIVTGRDIYELVAASKINRTAANDDWNN